MPIPENTNSIAGQSRPLSADMFEDNEESGGCPREDSAIIDEAMRLKFKTFRVEILHSVSFK